MILDAPICWGHTPGKHSRISHPSIVGEVSNLAGLLGNVGESGAVTNLEETPRGMPHGIHTVDSQKPYRGGGRTGFFGIGTVKNLEETPRGMP